MCFTIIEVEKSAVNLKHLFECSVFNLNMKCSSQLVSYVFEMFDLAEMNAISVALKKTCF